MHPCRYLVAAGVVLALTGCAAPPQGQRPAGKVAYITSGDTYFYGATRFGQDVAVTEVDGKPVEKASDLRRLIAAVKPGAKTTLTVFRRGAYKDLVVTVGEDERSKRAATAAADGDAARTTSRIVARSRSGTIAVPNVCSCSQPFDIESRYTT